MNSRSAGPSTTKRQRTPVSPSPSPEPVEGAGASALAPPFAHDPAGLGNTNGGADSIHPSSNATVVALEPAQEAARKAIEERCRVAVDDLMQLATCAAEVHLGDEDIVRLKVNETMESFQFLQDASDHPDLRQLIPEDVMNLIDAGRNPDLHTRTFTSRLNSDNQQMRGQARNFDRYRDRLREKLGEAFPEMQQDLAEVDRAATAAMPVS